MFLVSLGKNDFWFGLGLTLNLLYFCLQPHISGLTMTYHLSLKQRIRSSCLLFLYFICLYTTNKILYETFCCHLEIRYHLYIHLYNLYTFKKMILLLLRKMLFLLLESFWVVVVVSYIFVFIRSCHLLWVEHVSHLYLSRNDFCVWVSMSILQIQNVKCVVAMLCWYVCMYVCNT